LNVGERQLGALLVGADGAELAPGTVEFLRLLGAQAEIHLAGVLRLEQQAREINYLREHDDLVTKLPNRVRFRKRLRQALDQSARDGGVAVLFADLDGFNRVNRRHGYAAGDAVLREVGHRWQGLLQMIAPAGELARMGGDEFAVLLAGPQDGRRAAHVARAMLGAVKLPLTVPGGQCLLTASLGIARSTARLGTVEAILRAAEGAMNEAKRRGPGGWSEHGIASARREAWASAAAGVAGLPAPD